MHTAQNKTQGIIDDAISKVASTLWNAEANAAKWGEELRNTVGESLHIVEAQASDILHKVSIPNL